MSLQLVISCEHAANKIPDQFKEIFVNAAPDLDSHKGWDPGALEITEGLSDFFTVEPFIYPYTRLLIEPNRSLDNEELFSSYSIQLVDRDKAYLISQYYLTYRKKVEDRINETLHKGPVLHIGIHSFTPFWNGKKREVDIGILYDPARSGELKYGNLLLKTLSETAGTELKIKANEPYLGTDDGFTTYLRTRFRGEDYLGFEIEVNQGLMDRVSEIIDLLGHALSTAIRKYK